MSDAQFRRQNEVSAAGGGSDRTVETALLHARRQVHGTPRACICLRAAYALSGTRVVSALNLSYEIKCKQPDSPLGNRVFVFDFALPTSSSALRSRVVCRPRRSRPRSRQCSQARKALDPTPGLPKPVLLACGSPFSCFLANLLFLLSAACFS
eukprot:2626797-Rhodomonas_salina.4